MPYAPRKIAQLIEKLQAADWRRSGFSEEDDPGISCDICNDPDWWVRNGFSEAERQFFCGPSGLNCPGFGSSEGD